MLIFSRKDMPTPKHNGCLLASSVIDGPEPSGTISDAQAPPLRAMAVVQEFNATHDKDCEEFTKRRVSYFPHYFS
jgi:hypothetical protein